MKIKIPFVGGAYAGKSSNVDAQKCVNLFPIVDKEGGKEVVALRGTPGLVEEHNFNATLFFKTSEGEFLSPSGSDYFLVR